MGSFAYDDYGCIISIDFGTTFSGSCYALVDDIKKTSELNNIKNDTKHIKTADLDRETIINIQDWVNNKGAKTPTVVVYDEHMHLSHWGKAATDHIALKKGDNEIVLEKFKLKLPKSVSQKGAVLVSGNREQDDEEANMRATIDFFRVVYDHIFNQIHAQRPIEKIEFSKDNIRFVITVPAIWNDVERTIMRSVAVSAGLISEGDHENRLIIINESLAATLYCEREQAKGKLTKDINYIICDAGGGTVDIASFVATVPDKENASFPRCQLTQDSGDRCGSTYLDDKMSDLLMKVLFRPKNLKYTEEEEKEFAEYERFDYPDDEMRELEAIVADLLTQFNQEGGQKYKFPPPEGAEKTLEKEVDTWAIRPVSSSDSSESDSDSDDEEEEKEKEKKEKETNEFLTTFDIQAAKVIKRIRFKPVGKIQYIPDPQSGIGAQLLIFPYEVMSKEVFDPVVDTTIHLLKKQIRKINEEIHATYLVGGFGQNPYLQYRIRNEFKIPGKENKYRCGDLISDEKGNLAAMRGALYYGLDGSRKPTQTDIVKADYDQSEPTGTDHDGFIAGDYDTVICYDIGYDFTSCSYLDLSDKNNSERQFTAIQDWPGLKGKADRIPTAFVSPTEWGFQVTNLADRKPEEFVTPSKLMSIVKGDFRRYLAKFLKAMQAHVSAIIAKSGRSANPDKFRYCITMENCYQFFFRQAEMRRVAIDAGLITAEDNTKRLLLIKREDAAAMHFEKEHFAVEGTAKKAFSSKFLQIFFRDTTCHLSLQEATKLSGYSDKREQILRDKEEKAAVENGESIEPENETDANGDSVPAKPHEEEFFRNVRGVRSAIIPFNFTDKLIKNLAAYVQKNTCINCPESDEHEVNCEPQSAEFKEGFLAYIETELDFSSNEHIQKISIRKAGCCEIFISVYDLLEHVFRPAIRDLVSDISRYSTQVDIINFQMDKIFLIGNLVKAKEATYSFLERVITKSISDVLKIGSEYIVTSEKIKPQNHILGAQIYGEHPGTYTERVARKTYVVGIQAFNTEPFEQDTLNKIENLKNQEDSRDRIYDLEAEYALRGKKEIDLYYQPEFNPSAVVPRSTKDATLLIPRGQRVLEKDQVNGIEKRFYAKEECLVYASIYVTEKYHSDDEFHERNGKSVNLSDFQKIHRFEIYVKKDPEDPMASFRDNRLQFFVRMIPDNNEVVFEAGLGSRIGKKIPEFRFRDEILVAQIYNDVDRIPKFISQREDDDSESTLN